jgi:hypothetical protein
MRWARLQAAVVPGALSLVSLALGVGLGACGDDDGASPDATSPARAGDCLLSEDEVADASGLAISSSGAAVGGSAGDVGDGQYSLSWEGCDYLTGEDGGKVTVGQLVDDEGAPELAGFEQIMAATGAPGGPGDSGDPGDPAGSGEGDGPVVVDGIGDEAVRFDDDLYVRVGERAAVVTGEDAAGEALPPDVVDAVGAAAAAALG